METVEEPKKPAKPKRRWGHWVSLALLVFAVALTVAQPHALTALLVWPAWVWLWPGLIIALCSKTWRIPLAVAWVTFGFVFVEEFVSVPLAALPSKPKTIRIISLNCSGGTLQAAEDSAKLKPDLLLLQESPGKLELDAFAKRVFGPDGVAIVGPDAAIVGKGILQVPTERHVSNFVVARWNFRTGEPLNIVSLRLQPPTLRFDLYDPGAWKEFSDAQANRVKEMADIRAELQRIGISPDLIAGDFNAPPNLTSGSVLVKGLSDAFKSSGVGFGATCVSPMPCIVRIDQIWTSQVFKSVRTWRQFTANSDHMMLVADFE